MEDVPIIIPMDKKTEDMLEKLWYERFPSHELNSDTGKDMFWGTVICVMNDLIEKL